METNKDIKVIETNNFYQIDIADCPFPSIVEASECLSYNWLIDNGKQPDIIYLGWKTILALVFQMRKDYPELQLSDFTSFRNMEIRIVQDPWHLEVGFVDILNQIMACVKLC